MKALLLAAAVTLSALHPAVAGPDPKGTVQGFDDALLDMMKNAEKLGYQGRYDTIKPVIEQVYDLPLMARISVGPQWASLTPDQQTKIVAAFTNLSIATYAARFDGYGGEKLQIVGESPTTGGDDVVDTKMIRPSDDPIDLNYRLRKTGDSWKVIDVFLSGTISQLANYRSEFAATLREQGADGLIDLINQKVAGLAPK